MLHDIPGWVPFRLSYMTRIPESRYLQDGGAVLMRCTNCRQSDKETRHCKKLGDQQSLSQEEKTLRLGV